MQGVPKPALAVAGASLAEGNAGTQSLSFTVTLANPTPLRVSVAYATANGTATAGSDYTATSGTLVVAPGQHGKTIAVPIVGDTAYESDETFTLTLANPVNATLGTATATGTITNDDAAHRDAGPLQRADQRQRQHRLRRRRRRSHGQRPDHVVLHHVR